MYLDLLPLNLVYFVLENGNSVLAVGTCDYRFLHFMVVVPKQYCTGIDTGYV